MKNLHVDLIAEKNRLAGTGAWKELWVLEIGPVRLFVTPNPTPIVFDGQTYAPLAAQPELARQDALGGLPAMTLAVANVTRELSAYLEAHDLAGAMARVLIVHELHLADPAKVATVEEHEIVGVEISGEAFARIELGHDRFLSHRVPGRVFRRLDCGWTYRDAETCAYAGPLAQCSKRLEGPDGCRAHANVERFGGWPNLVSNAN